MHDDTNEKHRKSQTERPHPVLGIILAALIVFSGFYVYVAHGNQIRLAFKVTDPSDPRFDPMSFNFNDYSGFKARSDALVQILPLGADRSYVREVIAGSNATRKSFNVGGRKDADSFGYTWGGYPGGSTGYVFIFDDNNKLIRIDCSLNEKCVISGGE